MLRIILGLLLSSASMKDIVCRCKGLKGRLDVGSASVRGTTAEKDCHTADMPSFSMKDTWDSVKVITIKRIFGLVRLLASILGFIGLFNFLGLFGATRARVVTVVRLEELLRESSNWNSC